MLFDLKVQVLEHCPLQQPGTLIFQFGGGGRGEVEQLPSTLGLKTRLMNYDWLKNGFMIVKQLDLKNQMGLNFLED